MDTVIKPRFKRVDHVSLTVSDLEAAVAFYTEVMGARLVYRMGPFDARELPAMKDGRDWTEAHVNVKGARLHIAMLQLTEELGLELFRYELPETARQAPPLNCDVGARHLCLEVDDVQCAIEYLEQHDCKPMSGPIEMTDGPCPSSRSWYVLDPFGNQLELVEYL